MTEQAQAQFHGWAKVEVMGHQTHIGYVRTEAYGQAVMFRIDTPDLPEREYVLEEPAYITTGDENARTSRWVQAGAKVARPASPGVSVLVGAGSIYRILPCTEAAAMKAIETGQRPELKLISLPEGMALPAPESGCMGDPDDDGDDDDGLDPRDIPDRF